MGITDKEFEQMLSSNPELTVQSMSHGTTVPEFGTKVVLEKYFPRDKDSNLFVTIKEPINRSLSEHDDQAILFKFLSALENEYPVLKAIFAVPNGGYRPKRTAAFMKAEGAKAGCPDIWVPIAMHGVNGMVIEMKRGYKKGINKPSEDQIAWLNMMAGFNWNAFVLYHRETARKLIMKYLDLPDIKFHEVLNDE